MRYDWKQRYSAYESSLSMEKEKIKLDVIKHYLTKNRCYKKGARMTPNGILVHSTGCVNKNVTRYVDDESLGTVSSNHWNTSSSSLSKCVHGFLGYSETRKKVVVVNTLPYTMKCWGCGSGSKGSYNNNKIQFEICEGSKTDKAYFKDAYETAVEYCALLCKQYKFGVEAIVSHHEAHEKGYATNHGDADSYFKNFGKTMDQFRKDVKAAMNSSNKSTSTKADSSKDTSYKVRITAKSLNVRKGAGTKYDVVLTISEGEVYTIVDEKNGWGKLKSGAGWISLKYTKKL